MRSEVIYPLIQAGTCSRNQMKHLISCIAITSCSEVIAQGDRHGRIGSCRIPKEKQSTNVGCFFFPLVSVNCLLSPPATSLQREPKVRSAKKKANRRRPTLRTNTLIATIYSPLYPLSLFSCIARPQVLRRAKAGDCFVLRSEVIYPLIQAGTCSRNQMENLISSDR